MPLSIVRALTALHPAPLLTRRRGDFPLHDALRKECCSEEIILHLLDVGGDVVGSRGHTEDKTLDPKGPLPLELELRRTISEPRWRIVERLMELYPAAVQLVDEAGHLPLRIGGTEGGSCDAATGG